VKTLGSWRERAGRPTEGCVGQALEVGDRRSAGLGLGKRLQQLRATEPARLCA
jgi:hypothetical protein